MTHRKSVGSIEDAVDMVVTTIGGAQAAADLLGVSRSTIDSWKNPQRPAVPSIDHIIQLDVAYASRSNTAGPGPIINAMLFDFEQRRTKAGETNLIDQILEVRTSLDSVTSALISLARQERFGSPVNMSAEKVEEYKRIFHEAIAAIIRVGHSLQVLSADKSKKDIRNSIRFSLMPTIDPKK